MTAPSIPVTDFQRDQILTAAIRLTGILPYGEEPSAEQLAAANIHLTLTLEELQSDNIVLRTVERTTLALTSGQASYTLGAAILDIECGPNDVAGSIVSASGGAETLVTSMARGEYLAIAVKDTMAGRPSRVYVEKLNTVTLVFWPVPDSSTISFRYAQVRLLNMGDTGATTLDLRRVWAPYLTYSVAVGVALDNSLFEKASALRAWAAEKKALAQAGDVQHGTIRFRVGHRGINWR